MLVDLIKHAVAQPTFLLNGVRKIIQGFSWTEPNGLRPIDVTQLGYTKVKMTRLTTLYYNAEEVAKAKAKLKSRHNAAHSSVAIAMRGDEKRDQRSQGHCLLSVVISVATGPRGRRDITADVFYRSTEVIQKFHADLVLIKKVFDDLGIDPKPVRFHFANLYISAVFFPLLFSHTDGVAFLKHIRKHDRPFHHIASRGTSRYLSPGMNYKYGAVKRMKKLREDLNLDPNKLNDYLLETLGDYHKQYMAPSSKRKSTVRKIT